MSRILIDGRFVGVGDSMTRYTLEILKRLLMIDHQNQYTLLVRPQGVEVAKRFLKTQELKNSRTKEPVSHSEKANKSRCDKVDRDPDISESSGLQPNSYNLKLEVLDIAHYSLSEQTKLLSWLNAKKFDLVHFVQFNHPIRYRGKFVVTIHDLTLLGHLYRMEYKKRIGFKYVMKSAIKKSAKILTISQTSKDDIVEYYKIDPEKIVVTHLAVDDKYNNCIKNNVSGIKRFKEKYGIIDNYILYTGMWQRHKNLLRMLKAFEQVFMKGTQHSQKSFTESTQKNDCHCEESARLVRGEPRRTTRQSIQLVLVGKIDKDEPEILKEIDRINSCLPAIITTGFIDEEELPIAYAGALAYCIPSLSEGFGLPPLEAMASGTPVISSNISAMPEILGDAPLYFDPYEVSDIAKKMTKIIEDKGLRDQLSRKGLEQVKKYNWQSTAEKTLKVYQEVL